MEKTLIFIPSKKRNRTYVRIPLEDRFWSFVRKTDGCWLWTGLAKAKFGYGLINEGGKYGKTLRAHRVSWEMHYGPIPSGSFVCHRCDNPLCVNPLHLFLGSPKDNVLDCVAKGRSKCDHSNRRIGETHPLSKLSDNDREAIIQEATTSNPTLSELAEKYGVSIAAVHRIVRTTRDASIKHFRRAISDNQAAEIRQRHAAGDGLGSLAAAYDTSKTTIWRIVSGKVKY